MGILVVTINRGVLRECIWFGARRDLAPGRLRSHLVSPRWHLVLLFQLWMLRLRIQGGFAPQVMRSTCFAAEEHDSQSCQKTLQFTCWKDLVVGRSTTLDD